MNPEMATDILRQTLFICLEVSTPLLVVAMVVGLVISVFQSVTQINEMTLSFVPKMLLFAVVLGLLFPWMLKTMTKYTEELWKDKWNRVVSYESYAE